MQVADNIATVRRFYEAGPKEADDQRVGFADPAVVWHVPGANHVSGRYEGAEEVFERMTALMQPLDTWEIDVMDVFGNDDLVVATVSLRARRGPHEVSCPGAHVFRLDDSARIVEAWGFVRDQADLDVLFDTP